MTDSGGPQRRTLCFLSTLLSQKVPEKSDTVLRCIISGQPKPEVTWYKNGQTIEESDIISSYEFFENQYIHVLHLYGCTQSDAAIYQISAKNSDRMICCSASIEVECASKNTQLTHNPQDDGDTGWKPETQTHEQKSPSRIDEDVYRLGTVQSKLSKLTDDTLNNDEDLHSSHQNPKAQKYISTSLPLSEAATSIYPGDRATVDEQVSPQVSSTDSESDYELCPEITLTYTEEFSDDDLEYLECSDVMTDYSNAVWQRHLEGTECVFLLESDDEEVEFSKYCLGECEPFFSEMGCGPPVSDNTGLMLASAGSCGDHSRFQGVRVRRLRASTPSPPAPHTGMTLTLGSHEDGTSMVTEQGRYKRPTTSAENDYPGIQGETRDSHQAGAEPASDNLLTMDKAGTQREVKRLSGELEKSGMNQSLETVPENKVGEKDLQSKRSSEKPARARRPGTKGKLKKRSSSLKDSTAEGALNHLSPQEPSKHPLAQSDKKESSHAREEAPDLNSLVYAERALLPLAEQDARRLQTASGAPFQEGSPKLEGEEVHVNDLFETSWTPDQSDDPQVQTREPVRERLSLSPMPAFSEPDGEESSFTGTTTDAFHKLGGADEENESLTQYLEIESCIQGPKREENQDREDNSPGHSWEGPGHELNLPEANHATMSPCELSMHLPQEGSDGPREPETLSVASPAPADIAPILEAVCHGLEGREAECLMECLDAGHQGTGDTIDAPGGAPVHKYSPQEICSMDLELAEGQSQVPDLCIPDDKTLDVVLQTQGSEPPKSTDKSHKGRDSVVFPAPSDALTWDISQKASEGSTGEHLAKVEHSISMLASTGQERPSPTILGGLEERQPLSPENSLMWYKEGDESSSNSASDATDTPAHDSSIVTFPQEKPTALTATPECLLVTRENGNIPVGTIATKVHSAKYLPVSIAENSHADGPEESSAQVPDSSIFQLPSNVQQGHVLNGSATGSPKELCMAPSGPGVHVCAPLPPEGDSCTTSPLQIGNQARDKSQTVDKADHRSLGVNFQEKGSETTQKIQWESPTHQGSLSEDNFQESWPMTSTVQGETDLLPLGQSSANSTEERRQSSGLGTSVSVVTKAAVEDDSKAVSSALPLSQSPLEGSKESGPAHWEAGNKHKTMTLEASVSEVWPPRQPTASECEELEAGTNTPAGLLAVATVLKAGAAGSELDPSEAIASAASFQAEADSALAKDREIYEGRKSARRAHWSCLSSQYLRQPRFLESSVDPVDEGVTDWPSEASKTGWQETVSNVSQSQEENQNQLGVDHAAFFKQFLPRPEILESSVDPIDEMSVVEWARLATQELSDSTLGVVREESQLDAVSLGQRVKVQPIISPVPCPQQSEETIPSENSTNRSQEASERGEAEPSQHDKAKGEVQPVVLQVPHLDEDGVTVPGGHSISQAQEGHERSTREAEQSKKDAAGAVSPTLPLSSAPAVLTQASVGVDTDSAAGQIHDVSENHLVEPRNHQHAFSDLKERGERESECGKHLPSPCDLTQLPFTSSPEGNITDLSISHKIGEPKIEVPQSGETKPTRASSSPAVTLALVSGEHASETTPKTLQDPWHLGPTLSRGRKSGEGRPSRMSAQMGRSSVPAWGEAKKEQEITGSEHLTEGVKKKILSKVAALRLRLEERENTRKNGSFPKKIPKLDVSVSCMDENKDPKKPPCKREGKAPVLLKKIQAEMFPDHSGNVRLSCQFAEIHEDSTIWWTKDSKSIAQVQRSAGDNSIVSLTIVQASQKDQGLYYCCIKNSYGKVTAEFNLTTEVLKQLSSHQDIKGCEEIEFSQLIFREDFLQDSYFGDRLRGQIATEELHFGEGVHRKAFRSKVMQGLMPVFQPGHACVLKVHNAVAYGTRNNDELIQKNYNLAAQECYVQNTARHYAKIYAAEAQPLEGFGEVPEIIPIFLIHRPENNIPYATVEEELIGEFVKYSIRDGKEINFLRRDSEAGQKCCTFQHWVYQKTSGCLLVTDMQGVGMKLTDVGIATLAKGYKGFKGNCSMTFIDQFKALHQCNKYCKMLGLKSLQNNNQKQKKLSATKGKSPSNSITAKKTASGTPADKKT